MKVENIDKEIIRILKSKPSLNQLRFIIQENVLNKDEKELLTECVKNYNITGISRIEWILANDGFDKETFKLLEPYKSDDLQSVVDDLVVSRRKTITDEIIKKSLSRSDYDLFGEEAINELDKRYKASIYIDEDNVLDDLESYCSMEAEYDNHLIIENSIGIECIDRVTGGIPKGKLTAVVGMDNIYKHVLVINAIYNLIQEEKNVLFISLNYSKKDIYLDLMSRHSCNEKFNKKISKQELLTSFDDKTYSCIYSDIRDTLQTHLAVFDNEDLLMQNKLTLRRIFAKADERFKENTTGGIDLIVIDGLNELHIDRVNRIITNSKIVELEYLSFLKDMSRHFLGSNISIPIIYTINSESANNDLLKNGVYYNLSLIPESVNTLTDIILTVKGDKNMDKRNQLEISVIKSTNNLLLDATVINSDVKYMCINYKEKIDNEDVNSLLEYYKNDNEKLKKEMETLNSKIESQQPEPVSFDLKEELDKLMEF